MRLNYFATEKSMKWLRQKSTFSIQKSESSIDFLNDLQRHWFSWYVFLYYATKICNCVVLLNMYCTISNIEIANFF